MSENRVMNRWFAVLGAILMQIALGAIYAWSVFTPSLIQTGWTKFQTQVVFSIALVTFALTMVWAGKKLVVWGPMRLSFLSAVILGAGYVLAGLAGETNFILLCLFIGVIGGTGIGLGYVVPIAVGMRWFPDKKGFITGLAVAGFGFGAMAWVKLAGTWGNLIETYGLSTTFFIYGILFFVMIAAGGIFMKFPPEKWTPKGYSIDVDHSEQDKIEKNFSFSEMLKTPQFYLIFVTFTFSAAAGLMSIGLMKLYPMEALQSSGHTAAESSAIAGTAMAVFFSLSNGVGRIVWGSASDRLGRKNSILLMTSIQGVTLLLFTIMAGNEYMLYIVATVIGFNFGGNFALFPTITADTFGTKNVGQNYPYVFLAYGVGGLVGPMLGGMLGDMGNFPLAFTICGTCCLIGSATIYMTKKPQIKTLETTEFS
ncbi:L-lactate MFS transporter [Maridesulfovibrio zosterae]|uniref:L-lactate MFS transporter n=1 Tax=Maridesulfovibrio zosterae TaxID=82171 RepID=UPI0004264493|nr:OFA family MFS transporter [Maridesulfovibrio zosterae]